MGSDQKGSLPPLTLPGDARGAISVWQMLGYLPGFSQVLWLPLGLRWGQWHGYPCLLDPCPQNQSLGTGPSMRPMTHVGLECCAGKTSHGWWHSRS